MIVPRKTAPLAISADLSTQTLEVCLDFRKGMRWAIRVFLRPISLEVPQLFSSVPPLHQLRFPILLHPKKRIENT